MNTLKKIAVITCVLFGIHTQAQNNTVTFKNGKTEIAINKQPQKVVVFDLSVLETFQELGIPVAGVPNALPKHLSSYDKPEILKLGGITKPNIEAIAEMKPDLIIGSGRISTKMDSLQAIAPTITINIDNENYWASFEENVLNIAKLYGKEDLASKKLKELKSKLDKSVKTIAKNNDKVVTVLHVNGKFVPHGPKDRFGFVHDLLGAKPAYVKPITKEDNAPKDKKNAAPSPSLKEINPDVIFIIDRTTAISGETIDLETIYTDDLKSTNAFKNNKVYLLPGTMWYLTGSGLISVENKILDLGNKLK